MAEPADNEQVQTALAEVWARMLPTVVDRVAAIERAIAALAEGSSDVEAIDSGQAEAHKLAGVLGSFGLDRGTELARELEGRLGPGRTATDAPELARLAAELRAVVED